VLPGQHIDCGARIVVVAPHSADVVCPFQQNEVMKTVLL
jgi:hypothetical protein